MTTYLGHLIATKINKKKNKFEFFYSKIDV
jgi:hypothetical protein